MKIVALTGGIACGKSVVADMLRELGAKTIDSDQVARDTVAPGTEGHGLVVDRFGREVLDPSGAIDRGRLGQIVFSDPAARRNLEEIVHPRVYQALAEWIVENRTTALLILEIPLLFEVDSPEIYHATIAVVAPREVQIERLNRRSGYDEATVVGILAAQIDPYEKAKLADYEIDNGGDLAATRRQVEKIFALLTAPDSSPLE